MLRGSPGGFLEAFWKICLEKIRCKNNGRNHVENLERHPGRTHNRKKTSAKPLNQILQNSGHPLPQEKFPRVRRSRASVLNNDNNQTNMRMMMLMLMMMISVSNLRSVSHRSRRGFPSLPPRRARRDCRTPPVLGRLASFFVLFLFFSMLKKTMKNRMVKKLFLWTVFDCRPLRR